MGILSNMRYDKVQHGVCVVVSSDGLCEDSENRWNGA